MNKLRPTGLASRRTAYRRGGFSLAEVAISTLLVAILLISSLQAVGISIKLQQHQALRQTAAQLGDGLLSEILLMTNADETSSEGDSGDSSSGRAAFYRLDQFKGYTESPPRRRDGSNMDGLNDWQRKVEVSTVQRDDLAKTTTADTGIQRVTVDVRYRGQLIYQAVGIRTAVPN